MNTVEYDAYPRTERERYRVYVLPPGADPRKARTPQVVCTAGTPEALGLALVTMHDEGELTGMPVGVLDAVAGTWIVNPWEKP